MAQFRATIQGQRGAASRLGNKQTGMDARVNGWQSGVRVTAEHVSTGDRFWITATGGSNGAAEELCLGYVERNGEAVRFVPYRRSAS